MTNEKPPQGWYPDPIDKTIHRFWDGNSWTSKTRKTPLEIVDDLPGSESLPVLKSDPLYYSPRSKVKRNSIIIFVLFSIGFVLAWPYVFIPFSVLDKIKDGFTQEYYRNVLEIGLDEVDFSNETPEMREWYIDSWPSIASTLGSLDTSILNDSTLTENQIFAAYKSFCSRLSVTEFLVQPSAPLPPDPSSKVLYQEFTSELYSLVTACNNGEVTEKDIPLLEHKIAATWQAYEKFRPDAYAELFVIQGIGD